MAKGRKTGGGSREGIPNKSTTNARQAIAFFVEKNTPRLEEWLEQIAETEGPLAAFKCVQDMIEYHVPKLQRTEISGIDGGPITVIASKEDQAL